ncbi:MAG: OmpA family protein [Elusimicrobiota bacterium]
MKKCLNVLLIVTASLMMQTQVYSAAVNAKPSFRIAFVQSAAKAINYRNLKGPVEIDFKGIAILSDTKGVAAVRNNNGVLEIKAKFEKLIAPTQFGSEYITYILWAISPDGRATNIGELIVKNGRSQLNAKTSLQALSLIVTAEPYFAVSQPSDVVILENVIKADNVAKIEVIDAKYELLPKGQYVKNVVATEFQPNVMNRKIPFNVYQAQNAVRIAKAAGAETYAAESFKKAERLLALAETKEGGIKGQAMTAREAVQSAEDSRSIAIKRQAEEESVFEKQQQQAQVNSANIRAADATAEKLKAEDAQSKAEQAKIQSDNERLTALTLATNAVASSNSSQADAKAARTVAEKSKGQADVANSRAQKAEGEKTILRAQLLQQLNSILQTRDTARGLIVNMSDALFQTGSSELMPLVREKLAKIAGIISSRPDLKLSVEGHTDSVGSDEFNQQLSEKRAQAARDYLVSQGVSVNSIVSRGYGKTLPIESNTTSLGREKNRRVELVVSGETIGTLAIAK